VKEVGSGLAREVERERIHLGLKILDLDCVCILWVLVVGWEVMRGSRDLG